MANLGKKNGIYLARFRFQGKEYKKSLKTTDRKTAEGAMHRVEDALHRLAINTLTVPSGVDPGDFIVSGGTLAAPTQPPKPRVVPTLNAAIQEYQDNLGHLAESNRYTIGVHLRNLKKTVATKVNEPIDQIEHRDLEAFQQARLRERSRTTVSKERISVIQFFDWAVVHKYLDVSPAVELPEIKTSGDKDNFRTVEQIEAILARGGLTKAEEWALWDCLYLTPPEIAGVLALVRQRSKADISFLLHALPAYTGMRRGELLRLRWVDVEFNEDSLSARSRKQSRQQVETKRRIDLHPELKTILLDWQKKRPRGQYVICHDNNPEPLTTREANSLFWQPMRGTRWCLCSHKNRFVVTFHVYRHSFCSNLAAAGVDQRVIDQFMGHQSEAMRKRYRHLYPKNRRSAIESFSLAAGNQ
jgi:integrase